MASHRDDSDLTVRHSVAELSHDGSDPAGATLTCVTPPHVGLAYAIPAGQTIIGRGDEADLQLQMPGVSRRHAAITAERGKYVLTDMGSTNGTFCGGQRLTGPVRLGERETIRLGAMALLRFFIHEPPDGPEEAELFQRATHDAGTGIRTLRYFLDQLESEWSWSQMQSEPGSVLAVWLDRLAELDERVGGGASDFALAEVVALIRPELERLELLARGGTYELLILCRSTTEAQAETLAERLRRAVIKHSIEWNRERLPVTLSIGVACTSEARVTTAGDLLERARKRTAAARASGCNRVVGPGEQ